MATVREEHVHFLKRALVKQQSDTLTSGVTALGVMFLYCGFSAASLCFGAVFHQFVQFLRIHKYRYDLVIYNVSILILAERNEPIRLQRYKKIMTYTRVYAIF